MVISRRTGGRYGLTFTYLATMINDNRNHTRDQVYNRESKGLLLQEEIQSIKSGQRDQMMVRMKKDLKKVMHFIKRRTLEYLKYIMRNKNKYYL